MILAGLMKRTYNNLNKRIARVSASSVVEFWPTYVETKYVGTGDGAWRVPIHLLKRDSICYCVGVGLDASFDIDLAKFGALVYSFDPTPRSITYMKNVKYDHERINFLPIGIWSENKILKFYAPMNRRHVNYSVRNIHSTAEFFLAECYTLSSLMSKFGHRKIDLLKLDIEGSWYEVIDSVIRDKLDISIILVEFDSPVNIFKIRKTVQKLRAAGFEAICRDRDNYLFVKKSLL